MAVEKDCQYYFERVQPRKVVSQRYREDDPNPIVSDACSHPAHSVVHGGCDTANSYCPYNPNNRQQGV